MGCAVGGVADDDPLGFLHVGMGHPDPAKRRPSIPQPGLGHVEDVGRLDIAFDQGGLGRCLGIGGGVGRVADKVETGEIGTAGKAQPGNSKGQNADHARGFGGELRSQNYGPVGGAYIFI